jgi:hypothetical protein
VPDRAAADPADRAPARIFAICLIKDEGDVIEQCLRSAARWAHRIFVLDNGSADGTWEIVQDLARTLPQVVAHARDERPFQASMRGEVFAARRHESAPGDWWVILDADEFYREDPRAFLARVPPAYQAVQNVSIAFVLTEADVARWEADPALYADAVPVEQKMRWYVANCCEVRFFRHDARLVWPAGALWPATGALYPERIPMLHFLHRSPERLQRRIAVRRAALAAGTRTFRHELGRSEDWRGRVVPTSAARCVDRDGPDVIDPADLPALPLSARLPPWLVNATRTWKLAHGVSLGKRLRRGLAALGFGDRRRTG